MIERLDEPKLLINPPNPVLGVKERAYLECGCAVWVGRRWDNLEIATSAGSCSPEHDDLINRFNVLLFDSLASPSDVEVVQVCEMLLEQAEREILEGR
jgi:hypothetical protein